MVADELKELLFSLKDIKSDTSHIEIKSCQGGFPKRMWETISAFANTSGGGIIVLGVSETPEGIQITGLKTPAKYQSDLASICSQMVPPLRPLIEIHKIEGKLLVSAEIPEVSYKDKPCYYQGSGIMSGSFIRVADGDHQLTQYEVQGFLDGRGQPFYDVEPIPESSIADLDKELVELFLGKIRQKSPQLKTWDDQKVLKTYRILADHNNEDKVTLAGLLCLGNYPQKYFPGMTIHVLAYPTMTPGQTGEMGERLLDNIKIEGPILRAVPQAIKAIIRNLKKRTVVKGMFRDDVLEYPEIFLREALINAVAHRDYSPLARGSSVQIKVFPDRVEISNPGGLFGPVTQERLGEQGLQASRNSYLMKLLEDLPVPGENLVLCENRGTGIPTMINSLMKAGMEPPQFLDTRNQFRVVCFNHALFDKETLIWLEQYSKLDLSERQRFALAFVRHSEKISNIEYCRMNHCDSRIATRELNDLVQKKLMTQNGVGRWTYYTIKETKVSSVVSAPLKKRGRKNRSEELLAIFKKRKEVSRQEIQNVVKMSGPTISYWLRKLVKEEKIKPTTGSSKNPNVKYTLKKK
jgi:ATP-dependent DNA helicase RecG